MRCYEFNTRRLRSTKLMYKITKPMHVINWDHFNHSNLYSGFKFQNLTITQVTTNKYFSI